MDEKTELTENEIRTVQYLKKCKGGKNAELQKLHFIFQKMTPHSYEIFHKSCSIFLFCNHSNLDVPKDVEMEFKYGLDKFVLNKERNNDVIHELEIIRTKCPLTEEELEELDYLVEEFGRIEKDINELNEAIRAYVQSEENEMNFKVIMKWMESNKKTFDDYSLIEDRIKRLGSNKKAYNSLSEDKTFGVITPDGIKKKHKYRKKQIKIILP